MKFIRAIIILITIALQCSVAFAQQNETSVVANVSNKYDHFGYVEDQTIVEISGYHSHKGFSFEGILASNFNGTESYKADASYTYAFEQFFATSGIQYDEWTALQSTFKRVGLFIELEGRQEVLGLIPELHLSKSLNKSSMDYINFRLGKEFYEGRFLINPYVEFAIGSIYSDSFKSNNFLVGIDFVTPVSTELYLSPNLAINIPLNSVKDFDDSAKTTVEIGLALRKNF